MSKLKKAMDKAMAEREMADDALFEEQARKVPEPAPIPRKSAERKDPCVQNFSVAYSQTRVQPVDPEVLKQNKVISLFHDHQMADHLKTLRTQILNSLEKLGGNTLLITSAHPGEGKTFMAINLGVSIAQEMDHTVAIVDADLRKPAKDHFSFSLDFFGIAPEKGLSDYLQGQAEIEELLINPGIPKMTILPAGRSMANSAEHLGSPRMEALVREMRERYCRDRIVIFDSPALLVSADPMVFARGIDGVLLVVEAEKTTPADLKRCGELLSGCNILGTVLNKAR
ncbi:putative exopolysaccharide/PEPCTERM locus tyrosine autokinase [delta proteobacterium NaphS2]|nr:putative exopolysaccharide/PEPCTERM locus tyrosine autokinase [delta proteobacterium NaphS2]